MATLAHRLAQYFRLNQGEAFVAGLLHDIGKLILLMHHGKDYARLMERAVRGEQALHILEEETFGADHALVGHALCLHWNLPSVLAKAVAGHHAEPAPRTVAEVVSRANDLVKTLQIGNGGNRFVAPATLLAQPHDQLDPDRLREMVLALSKEARQGARHSSGKSL